MNAIHKPSILRERTAVVLLLLFALALFGCKPAAGQQDDEQIAPLLDGMGVVRGGDDRAFQGRWFVPAVSFRWSRAEPKPARQGTTHVTHEPFRAPASLDNHLPAGDSARKEAA